jgi:large subunit ribosomal protein L9
MKVLLKEDVDNLGYAGEVFEVAAGYGRNYLIPQGLAVKATSKVMKRADAWRKRAEARRAEMRAEHEILATRIQEVTLSFEAKAGSTGKLYGSVTTTQIADALNETLGTDIDRRRVGNEPLRQLGEHKVAVRLSSEFQPELTVAIIAEGEELEEAQEGMVEEVEIAEVVDKGDIATEAEEAAETENEPEDDEA